MSNQQAILSDLVTEVIEDSIRLNGEILSLHEFLQANNVLVLTVLPSDLVKSDSEYNNVRHLLFDGQILNIEITSDNERQAITIVFDNILIDEYFLNSSDRTLEAQVLRQLVQQFDLLKPSPDLLSILEKIEAYKIGKPRYKRKAVKKIAAFPEFISPNKPREYHHKMTSNLVARLALAAGLKPGEYDDAKEHLNILKNLLVAEINRRVQAFSYKNAVPFLITRIDALLAQEFRDSQSIRISLEHEVEFDRAAHAAESNTDFWINYKAYRYLIEKFVQLTPYGDKILDTEEFQFMVSLVHWSQVKESELLSSSKKKLIFRAAFFILAVPKSH